MSFDTIKTDKDLHKKVLMETEFREVIENKNVFSPVATKVLANAKSIAGVFVDTGDAKAHTLTGHTPTSGVTITKDEIVLDRYIGNSLKYYEDGISFANYNQLGMQRADLYASVMKKANVEAFKDFKAGATTVATAKDLSTKEKVKEFILQVKTDTDYVGVKSKVDGGVVKRAEKHGKPFIACGTEAFVKITSSIDTIVSQSTDRGVNGDMVEAPYGVTIINMGNAAATPKDLLYGTAGVPVIGYRKDLVKVDMGRIVSSSVAPAASLDVAANDATIEEVSYMKAQTLGKNGIFASVKNLVKVGKMA